jgi:cell division protein FtsL
MGSLNNYLVLIAAAAVTAVYLARVIHKTMATRRKMRDLVGSISSEEAA